MLNLVLVALFQGAFHSRFPNRLDAATVIIDCTYTDTEITADQPNNLCKHIITI